MSANLYQILGVAPGAEDAVIRAAYRALMRLYHPDTNPDPQAQSRAREITAAFNVLGNAERRAAYDAGQVLRSPSGSGGGTWSPPDPRSAPPMRAAGLASIAVAIAVTLAFALPKPQPGLEPQALRNLAAYRGVIGAEPAPEPVAPPVRRVPATDPVSPPPVSAPAAAAAPREAASPPPPPPAPRVIAEIERRKPVAVSAAPRRTDPASKPAVAPSCTQCSDRRAQVERLATGFLKQSLEHADFQKQQLLLSARNRSATSRNLCRSDDCVTEAYMRQIRDTTTIMEGRIPNP